MPCSAAAASIAALVLCACATSSKPQWDAATIPVSSALPASSTMVGRDAPPSSTWANADPDDTFVCSIERPTGTNIAYRICRSLSRMDRDRGQAQDKVIGLLRHGGVQNPAERESGAGYQ